jgi:hypothetical protein
MESFFLSPEGEKNRTVSIANPLLIYVNRFVLMAAARVRALWAVTHTASRLAAFRAVAVATTLAVDLLHHGSP